ncbi:Gfo/Idh/MocA family protein [Butyrivibrio sp. AE3006]|uniref:Gfo/Idh/MocA family protein n=1 Tax=Butyrivibrio sp. AE3006 TaxID=1280673 RepID=UPI0004087BFF|nr:Gfo/Idh/MocA family oxidoreductase [Butyrivibrio sp. AE3006]
MSEMRKLKTAVVGCGMISDIYIRNLAQLFSVTDLVAIANRTVDKAKEKAGFFGIPKAMTIDEVAEDPEIELVVVLTPAPAHYDIIKKMLLKGKHVYTEKMFTTDVDQARELVELAEQKNLLIGVAPDTILGAGTQTARLALERGMIGDVTGGVVSINRNQNLNSELFRFLQEDGGALPYDVGIYYVATLVTLLGPVKEIRAFTSPAPVHERELLFTDEKKDSWQIPGSNVVSAALKFENGALISLHVNGNTINNEQNLIMLFGTNGIMKVGNPDTFNGKTEILLAENDWVTLPFTHGYNGENKVSEPMPFDHYGSRGVGVAELAYSILAGRSNRCSKEYGLHCMEVLKGIDIAAETGTTYSVESTFEMTTLTPGYYSTVFGGFGRGDAERSLV